LPRPFCSRSRGEGQRLLVVLDSLLRIAKGGVGQTQVAQISAFAPPVPDLAGNGQMQLVVVDGLPGIAQMLTSSIPRSFNIRAAFSAVSGYKMLSFFVKGRHTQGLCSQMQSNCCTGDEWG